MQIKSVVVGSADALHGGAGVGPWTGLRPHGLGAPRSHGRGPTGSTPSLRTNCGGTSYVVQAESLAEARALLPLFRSEGRAQRFVLVIRGLFPAADLPVWTPRSLQVKAGTSALTVPGLGFAVVVEGGKWVNVHAAALAALGCCSPAAPRPVLGGLRVGITEPAASAWLAGDALGSFMTEQLLQPEPDDIYSVDVLVGPGELTQQLSEQTADNPGRVTPPVWTPPGTVLPPVDTAVVSPMGFLPYAEKPARALEPGELGRGGELSEAGLAALRPHKYLEVDGARFGGLDWQLARRLSQLAVAGVPLLARALGCPGAVPARRSAGGPYPGLRRRRPAGAAGIEVDRTAAHGTGPLQPAGRLEHRCWASSASRCFPCRP